MSEREEPESRTLRVPRTARFHLLGPKAPPWSEVWVVLHGYAQLARSFLRRFRALDDGRRLVVAPEALSRFYVDVAARRHGTADRVGASWMTREAREDEIRDYVEYLDRLAEELFGVGEGAEVGAPLRVLGFSQGGHTAARWSVRGSRRPDQLVLWGSHLPPDLDPERAGPRLAELDLVLVDGRTDPFLDDVVRQRDDDTLARWGVPYRRLEHPGGHEIDPELLKRLSRKTERRPRS